MKLNYHTFRILQKKEIIVELRKYRYVYLEGKGDQMSKKRDKN